MGKFTPLDFNKYAALARQAAAEGCVLLKNENEALPLRKGDKVAVFGRIAFHYYKSGLGSGGLVNTKYVVGILDDLKEEKVIYKNHFEMDRVLELMDFLKQFDLMESISLNGQSYANKKEMQNIDYYELDSNTKAIVQGSRVLVDDLEMFVKEQSTTVEKTTLLFKTMEERQRAADALSKIEDIQFSSSLPKNLEISKKGCNKGDGLFHLAKILNIQKEEIMSCGDADNDRELLESAGLAVVMENGLDSMKAIADYITVSNQENGVAKAMEKFVLR